MDEDGLKAVLREAFGDSSDSDCELGGSSDGFEKSQPIFVESYTWEPITEISGLWICRDFLSPDQQSSLLSSIEKGTPLFAHFRTGKLNWIVLE